MSNSRNSRNANATCIRSSPTKNSTSRNATTSSQTIAPWSDTPRSRPVTSAAQMPMTVKATIAAANTASPQGRSTAASGMATSVPNVPGRHRRESGAEAQREHVRRMREQEFPVGLDRAHRGFVGRRRRSLSVRRRASRCGREMVERARQRRQRRSGRVAHDEPRLGRDLADARHRHAGRDAGGGDALAVDVARGEQELVVVAAGEQAFERQRALRPVAPRGERRARGNAREVDARAHLARGEQVAEVAGQAVRDVEHRGRDAAQREPQRDARLRPVQPQRGRRRAPRDRASCARRAPPAPARRRPACPTPRRRRRAARRGGGSPARPALRRSR